MTDLTRERGFCDGCDHLHPETDLTYLTPEGMEEGFYMCPECLRIDSLPNKEWLAAKSCENHNHIDADATARCQDNDGESNEPHRSLS